MDKLPDLLQFQPPEKQREPDAVLRLTCIEILLLLCTSAFAFSFSLFCTSCAHWPSSTVVFRGLTFLWSGGVVENQLEADDST